MKLIQCTQSPENLDFFDMLRVNQPTEFSAGPPPLRGRYKDKVELDCIKHISLETSGPNVYEFTAPANDYTVITLTGLVDFIGHIHSTAALLGLVHSEVPTVDSAEYFVEGSAESIKVYTWL